MSAPGNAKNYKQTQDRLPGVQFSTPPTTKATRTVDAAPSRKGYGMVKPSDMRYYADPLDLVLVTYRTEVIPNVVYTHPRPTPD